jgi:hypothetical protein
MAEDPPKAQPISLKDLATRIKTLWDTLWENRESVIEEPKLEKLREEFRSISTAMLGASDKAIEEVVKKEEGEDGKAVIRTLGKEITEGLAAKHPKNINQEEMLFLWRRPRELGLHVLKEPPSDPTLSNQGGRRKTYRKLRKLRKGRRSTRRRGGNPLKLFGNKPKSPFTPRPTQPAGQEEGDAKRLDAAVGTQDEATSRAAVKAAVAERKGGRSTKSRRRR